MRTIPFGLIHRALLASAVLVGALFLASPAARVITGVALPVDGGLMAGNRMMAEELTLEQF